MAQLSRYFFSLLCNCSKHREMRPCPILSKRDGRMRRFASGCSKTDDNEFCAANFHRGSATSDTFTYRTSAMPSQVDVCE